MQCCPSLASEESASLISKAPFLNIGSSRAPCMMMSIPNPSTTLNPSLIPQVSLCRQHPIQDGPNRVSCIDVASQRYPSWDQDLHTKPSTHCSKKSTVCALVISSNLVQLSQNTHIPGRCCSSFLFLLSSVWMLDAGLSQKTDKGTHSAG